MPLFGKTAPAAMQKLKVVPRQPGDTRPLEPMIADALRKAGMDPDKFTLAPTTAGSGSALRGMPPAGSSLQHTFLFTDRSDALRCVEAFADRGRPVTITKDQDGWWVVINGSEDRLVDDDAEHRSVATEVTALGGTDRGFLREKVTLRTSVKR